MELFPAQPDLSLQISPPNSTTTKPTSTWRRSSSTTEEDMNLGFWKRALDSRNSSFDLSLSNTNLSRVSSESNNSNHNHHFHTLNANNNIFQTSHYFPPQNHQLQGGLSQELGFLRPIRGIPVYRQNPHPSSSPNQFPFVQQSFNTITCASQSSPSSIRTNFDNNSSGLHHHHRHHHQPHMMRSRFMPRFPAKRSMRAPRMRWTTTLHGRFVHAVELLGGHEIKTTDRAPASSGQSDVFDNGSSGDTSEDMMFDIQNRRREAWLHGKPIDSVSNMQSLEKNLDPNNCLSFERISPSDVSSSPSPKKPNLEFTLGRPALL
ncbi:transcription factor KAN2 isoform X4 [Tripterygium wilfordii]|uniref:Transcription factor KAN2 isoform X4 n=1 Tax=Tripterygium wilfordii TaxID=458696 RepID=A0A7J7C787_TRIWF|nr:transcription factor KAN2 isoform X4 [Tripterygium wilfordii]